MRRLLILLPLLALVHCGPPPVYSVLPPDAVTGAGDPTRAAILGTAYAFSSPSILAGRPDAAARAVAQVEYLTTELPTGPNWAGFSPLLPAQLVAARAELRGTLGIAETAPPQEVVDELYAVGRALRAGDAPAATAAMRPQVFADSRQALARLANLPALPRTSFATAFAEQELTRTDQQGRYSGGDNSGKD